MGRKIYRKASLCQRMFTKHSPIRRTILIVYLVIL